MHALVDTDAVKRAHPIEEIVAEYGIVLRPAGYSLIGRCPFHADGGRPNFHVYLETQSWFCYRCQIGGDVISFVERMEGVDFREAVARLAGDRRLPSVHRVQSIDHENSRRLQRVAWGPDEYACLAAAVELYHNRLLRTPAALAYVESRGLDRGTIECCRVGYTSGDELRRHLHLHRLPGESATRVGLLRADGRESMAGRVVVPEVRGGQPIWVIGRIIGLAGGEPKYLGLPGRKPLLGWETAAGGRVAVVTEGVFDWLTLRSWGYPAVALVGTHARPDVVAALTTFERVLLVLDTDPAGREASYRLAAALGDRAVVVTLPGVKDVGELAMRSDGPSVFAQAIRHVARSEAA